MACPLPQGAWSSRDLQVRVRSSGWFLHTCTHGVPHRAAATVSPGSSLENMNLRPHPEWLNQELQFNQGPRWITCSLQIKTLWSKCMLFLQVASPQKHSGQLRYNLAIAQLSITTNYPKPQWPVTTSVYSHACGSVGCLGSVDLGRLGSRLRLASGFLPASPKLPQLAGYLFCTPVMVMKNHRKAEASPKDKYTPAFA